MDCVVVVRDAAVRVNAPFILFRHPAVAIVMVKTVRIFAADALPGGAVVVTLCSAVKAAFLRQPVQGIVDKVH
nr:hypothetical protein [Buttiauxella sp. 3AFRM03]